jgi:hypothetical protein
MNETKRAEFPEAPEPVDVVEACVYALMVKIPRGRHGQLCPVWTVRSTVNKCDCWQLPGARMHADTVFDTMRRWDESH